MIATTRNLPEMDIRQLLASQAVDIGIIAREQRYNDRGDQDRLFPDLIASSDLKQVLGTLDAAENE